MAIQIKRGLETLDPSTSEAVLQDGQLFYSKRNKKLYVGETNTRLKDLRGTSIGLNIENDGNLSVSATSSVSTENVYDTSGENICVRPNVKPNVATAPGYQAFAFGGSRFDHVAYNYIKIGTKYYDVVQLDPLILTHSVNGVVDETINETATNSITVDSVLYTISYEEVANHAEHLLPIQYTKLVLTDNGTTIKSTVTNDSDKPITSANGPQSFAFGGGNIANGAWDFTAGKLNTVNSTLSLVYGSANTVGTEADKANQQNNIIVGAVNKIGKCPSSVIVGDTLKLNEDSTNDCKTGAVFGQTITAKEFSQCLIGGRLHNIDSYRTLVFGHNNTVTKCADEAKDNDSNTGKVATGDSILVGEGSYIRGGRCNALFGSGVRIGDGASDTPGECKSYNTLVTGNGSYANWAKQCVVAGNYSGVQGSSSSYVTNTFVFGSGLRTRLSDAFIIGKNHNDVTGARFIIGNGESETSRSNLITVTDAQTNVKNELVVTDNNIIVDGDIKSTNKNDVFTVQAQQALKLKPGADGVTDKRIFIEAGTSIQSDGAGFSIKTGSGTISGATITRIDQDISSMNTTLSNNIEAEAVRAQTAEQELASDITSINNTFNDLSNKSILTGTIDNGVLTINLVPYSKANI